MVVAVIGTWLAVSGPGGDPAQRYVVARRAMAPGHTVTAADVAVARYDLPAGFRGRTFADTDEVVGSVVLGPLAAGDLVQGTAVTTADRSGPAAEFSFAVDAEWALAGELRIGDRIDVYATADDRTGTARRVLTNVTVQRLSDPGDGGLADDGRLTITVSAPDADALGEAVSATRNASITVVRVTDARSPTDHPADPAETSTTTGTATTGTPTTGPGR